MAVRKAKRGFSLHGAVIIGTVLNDVLRQLEKLKLTLEPFLSLTSLKEQIDPDNYERTIKKDLKNFFDRVKIGVNDINSLIKEMNEIIAMIRIDKKLVPLRYRELTRIIRERFYLVVEEKKTRKLREDNFNIRFSRELDKTAKSVVDLIGLLSALEKFEEIKSLKDKYKKGMHEAIDIFSIGYNETSVLVVGRTVETLLDDILKKCIKEKTIRKFNLKKIRYDDKIGMLKGNKIINEKSWHDLNSIRIERNETGHPIYNEIKKSEARSIIFKSILVIKKLQNKTN